MSELEPNAGSSAATPPPVIVARMILLLAAAVAAVWAFAFSDERGQGAGNSGQLVHVHGPGIHGAQMQDHAAGDSEGHVHGTSADGAGGHDHHAAEGSVKEAHAGHHHAAHSSGADAHARHQHETKNESSGAEPPVSLAVPVAPSDKPLDHKIVGTAERRVFALEVRAPAWLTTDGVVTAVLRKDQLAGLSPSERAAFFRATAPSAGVNVRLVAEPPAPWDGSTARVRFRLETRGSALQPGEVGWVRLAPRSRELLVIPSSALLYSSAGPYVLAVGTDDHALSRRRVEIGTVSRGLAVVLAGLREGEPIIVGSAFSWDAERRLQPRNEEIAGVTR